MSQRAGGPRLSPLGRLWIPRPPRPAFQVLHGAGATPGSHGESGLLCSDAGGARLLQPR